MDNMTKRQCGAANIYKQIFENFCRTSFEQDRGFRFQEKQIHYHILAVVR